MSSLSETSRSSKPTLVNDMSNLAIVAAASKSTISTAAYNQEEFPPEDAQAQGQVHAKPEQLDIQETSEESIQDTPIADTQNTAVLDTEESGSDHSLDDEIPHDGGSDLWKAIRLKKDKINRYEAMIEKELKDDKLNKERSLLMMRDILAQQIVARDMFLRKQAELDRQGRNARWG
jgi:hypothetical protein